MTNYTDFTSYNNPYGIDWNRINAEEDDTDELCFDIENEDGTVSENPRWAEFEVTEHGMMPKPGKSGEPSEIHGISEDVLGSLDAVIQFHAQWIDGKWKSTGEPIGNRCVRTCSSRPTTSPASSLRTGRYRT
jgi:hypothetical protein